MITVIFLGLLASGVLGASLKKRQLSSMECNYACPEYYHPVCGSDGHTYPNECFLGAASCHSQLRGYQVYQLHSGPCAYSTTRGYYTTTTTASTRFCNQICNEDVSHVCGSDGVVYKNTCLFQRAQCEASNEGRSIYIVAHADTCPTPKTPECEQYHVDLSDLAVEQGTHIQNGCPYITNQYVCASNGKTYNSECLLCQFMEQTQQDLQVLHEGYCYGGGYLTTLHYPFFSHVATTTPPFPFNYLTTATK